MHVLIKYTVTTAGERCAPAGVYTPVTPVLDKSLSDLSLKQLQERIANSTPNTGSRSGLVRTPTGSSGGSTSNSRTVGRGVTPQRLFSSSTSSTGPLTGGLLGSRPVSQQLMMRSMPVSSSSSNSSGSYRSSSANRERPTVNSGGNLLSVNSSIASLRATLHTDTVSAANRPKTQPEGVISQSSDFVSNGWRAPLTPGSTSSRPSSTVARMLAPNGQPRKVPAAALALSSPSAAVAGMGAGMVKGTALQTPSTPQQGTSNRFSAYYSS